MSGPSLCDQSGMVEPARNQLFSPTELPGSLGHTNLVPRAFQSSPRVGRPTLGGEKPWEGRQGENTGERQTAGLSLL